MWTVEFLKKMPKIFNSGRATPQKMALEREYVCISELT